METELVDELTFSIHTGGCPEAGGKRATQEENQARFASRLGMFRSMYKNREIQVTMMISAETVKTSQTN